MGVDCKNVAERHHNYYLESIFQCTSLPQRETPVSWFNSLQLSLMKCLLDFVFVVPSGDMS